MIDKCPHCGLIHEQRCHLVKAIEYFPDGTVKRVEYLTPADYASPWPNIFPNPPIQPIQPNPPDFIPSPIPYCSADPSLGHPTMSLGHPTMLPDGTWWTWIQRAIGDA